jgi:hypothetical protein
MRLPPPRLSGNQLKYVRTDGAEKPPNRRNEFVKAVLQGQPVFHGPGVVGFAIRIVADLVRVHLHQGKDRRQDSGLHMQRYDAGENDRERFGTADADPRSAGYSHDIALMPP